MSGPSIIATNHGNTKMSIAWSFPGAVKYSVSVNGPNSNIINLQNTTATTYELTGLTPKTSYNISVTAIKSDNTSAVSSITSSTLNVTPFAATITATNITNTSFLINWLSSNAYTYSVKVTPGNFKIATTKETSALVTHLNPNTTYKVSVIAYGYDNKNPSPKIKEVKTTNIGPSIPKLIVSNITATSMDVAWKSELAVKYNVQIGDIVTLNDTKTTSYSLTGLERKTKYNVSITAFDSAGTSNTLNDSVATLADFVECPSINFKNVTGGGFTAGWNSPSAVKYDVTITPGDFSLMGTTLKETVFTGPSGTYTVNVKAYGPVKAFITNTAVQAVP
jgi:hypothetical protein